LEDNLTELVLNGEEDIRFITSTEDLSPKTESIIINLNISWISNKGDKVWWKNLGSREN